MIELRWLIFLSVLSLSIADCPFSWIHFGNFCYLFSNTAIDWFSAASSCREHDARLAEVDTKEKDAHLRNFITQFEPDGRLFWLGGRDDEVEGQWKWSSGVLFSFKNWSPGEPTDDRLPGDEDCLFLYRSGWYDHDCTLPEYYICEKEYVLVTNE